MPQTNNNTSRGNLVNNQSKIKAWYGHGRARVLGKVRATSKVGPCLDRQGGVMVLAFNFDKTANRTKIPNSTLQGLSMRINNSGFIMCSRQVMYRT